MQTSVLMIVFMVLLSSWLDSMVPRFHWNMFPNCMFNPSSEVSFLTSAPLGFEAAAWYWHFVDVVWLFLFVAIYWWGGA